MNLQFTHPPRVTIEGDVATTRAALLVEIQAPIGRLIGLEEIADELTKEFYGPALAQIDQALIILENGLDPGVAIAALNIAKNRMVIELIDENEDA